MVAPSPFALGLVFALTPLLAQQGKAKGFAGVSRGEIRRVERQLGPREVEAELGGVAHSTETEEVEAGGC